MKAKNVHSHANALTNVKDLKHTLHLYTPSVDKYSIQRAFLASIKDDEMVVYVTADAPEPLTREFNSIGAELRVIKPEGLRNLETQKDCKIRIVIDAGSITDREKLNAEAEERESYINELSKQHSVECLCTYDVTKLNRDGIKQLTMYHNQLRLTTSDLTVLSGDVIDKSGLSDDSVEKMVKDYLETIVLALIQREPMCGTKITELIHLEFGVLLSPGTLYPLLHSLKRKELITSKKYGKAKIYAPAKNAELKIKNLVNEKIQASKLLSQYLQQETI